jgi:predicted transposase YbfD/YdcC
MKQNGRSFASEHRVLPVSRHWAGLQSIIKITATREISDKITTEERCYISSPDTKKPFSQYIGNHWCVENSLHWTSDMIFREDGQRKRDKRAAGNFAIVREIGLNLLKKDTATKATLVSKRLKAAWNKDFLCKLIGF